jgi:hypothetical protein
MSGCLSNMCSLTKSIMGSVTLASKNFTSMSLTFLRKAPKFFWSVPCSFEKETDSASRLALRSSTYSSRLLIPPILRSTTTVSMIADKEAWFEAVCSGGGAAASGTVLPADAAASPTPSPAPLAGGCRGIAGRGRDGNVAHPRCEEINGAALPPTLKERLPDPAVLHGSARPRHRRAVARVRSTRRGRVALLRDQRLPSILALTRQSLAGPVDIWLWQARQSME